MVADQLDMFAGPRPARPLTISAAPVDETTSALANRLPAPLRMGTCGWAHPGWAGSIYEHTHPAVHLQREGLGAYAHHPLLSTVTLERTRHRVPPRAQLRALAAQTPEAFRFVAYTPYGCACPSFGRNKPNPDFLSPQLGARLVGELIEGLGSRLGLVLLEIPYGDPASYGGRRRVADRLARLLAALPAGPSYALEPHDHKWIGPAYARMLDETGAAACRAVHPSTPPLDELDALATNAPLVVHWACAPRFDYESHARYLQPFDARCQPDPDTLARLVPRIHASLTAGRPTWVLVDNLAEGCAPQSIAAIAQALVDAACPVDGPPVP